jgi:TctA family transporter
MDLSRALADIAEIQAQMAKGEIYRGYRPLPVAASGLIGIAAAYLQAPALGAGDPVGFVLYWIGIAVFAGFVGASEIIFNYVVHEGDAARRQTRRVVGQFLPSVLGAAIVTFCFIRLSATFVPLLPGLWAICFGLGTFASRPYLPRGATLVALFYYAAGVWLLWIAQGEALSAWWVGGTFGVGQLIAAAVLFAGDRRQAAGDRWQHEEKED